MREKTERMAVKGIVLPKACPFCGAELVAIKTRDMVNGGVIVSHYYHPMSDCILSYFKIFAKEVEAWNKRAELK